MTNTRTAREGSPFRQERYCSSNSYETGLLCNIVAKRCRMIECEEDRALIYFLQQFSHKEGGLKKFADDFLKIFSDRIGTPLMHKYGMTPDKHYTDRQIKKIRKEIPDGEIVFPLYGEFPMSDLDKLLDYNLSKKEEDYNKSVAYPKTYPVDAFIEHCESNTDKLSDYLKRICLDPVINISSIGAWYFNDLFGALHEYRRKYIEKAKRAIAETEVTKKIYDDLDFAKETRSFVVIEGDTRVGKSTAAGNWCQIHAGDAVYVKLESGNDDITFFRSIARALGTACSTKMKPAEIRIRIEDTLQEGHIALVLDEAHFLWPQTTRPRKAPNRVDWLRTSLIDYNVPVILISTHQLEERCSLLEKKVGWNSRQIRGRVALHTTLPSDLSEDDLSAIAKHLLPEANKTSILRLVGIAEASDDYVAGMERIAKRARFFAKKSGRTSTLAQDVKKAVNELVPPRQKQPSHESGTKTKTKKIPARATTSQRFGNRLSFEFQKPGNGNILPQTTGSKNGLNRRIKTPV